MIAPHSLVGLAGQALLAACAAALVLCRVHHDSPARAALRVVAPLVAALVCLAPFGHLSAAAYLRGYIGDLSVTSVMLLALYLLSYLAGRDLLGDRTRRLLYPALALLGGLFYPLALGLTGFDPYLSGYGSYALLGVLAGATFAAWIARLHLIAAILVAALAAQLAGVLESRNLWDYLLDPLVTLYAIGWTLRRRRPRYAGPPTAPAPAQR